MCRNRVSKDSEGRSGEIAEGEKGLPMYTDLIVNNRSFIKRFSHSRRFEVAVELLEVRPTDEILDVGTGDGYMLHKIVAAGAVKVVGYEPVDEQYRELSQSMVVLQKAGKAEIIRTLEELEPERFEKICCLEVFEHLTEQSQRSMLARMRELLRSNGLVVISVPIEVGLASLFKNLVRCAIGQTHPNTSVVTMLKSFLGMQIDRGSAEYIPSHIGFDWRDLEELFLVQGFRIMKKAFSPFSALGGGINSQVFYVLQKHDKADEGLITLFCHRRTQSRRMTFESADFSNMLEKK